MMQNIKAESPSLKDRSQGLRQLSSSEPIVDDVVQYTQIKKTKDRWKNIKTEERMKKRC